MRGSRTAGGKSRLVALSPVLIDALLPDTGANVVTGDERVYTAGTLQRRVNRAIQSNGVDATFHAPDTAMAPWHIRRRET